MTEIPPSSDSLSDLPIEIRLQIEKICQQFEQALRDNHSPRIEDILEEHSDIPCEPLLRELLLLEIEQAVESGRAVNPVECRSRFPNHQAVVNDVCAQIDQLQHTATLIEKDSASTPETQSEMETLPNMSVSQLKSELPENIRYFGKYELLKVINKGGMGIVYQARQLNLGRIVAVKSILSGVLATENDVARFRIEAQAAAKLDHPGIVPIFEIGEHNGLHYFSMAYIDGPSLAKLITNGPLAPNHAARIMQKVAEAVQYAHEHQVIHRDIKPANILMVTNEEPRVTDFGLAKHLDADHSLSGTGQVLGTPGYMSPEQAAGSSAKIGPATDIYSLGATLYALITGQPPFQSDSILKTIQQVQEKTPVSPRELNPAIDKDLETICLHALEKEPERRYASAKELADDLMRWQNREPISAKPDSLIDKSIRKLKRYRKQLAVAATVLIAILGIWYWAVFIRVDPYTALRREEVQRMYERVTSSPPQPIIAPYPEREIVKTLPPANSNDFEVIERSQIWDMRAWKPYDPSQPAQLHSAYILTDRVRLRKLKDTSEYRKPARTQGVVYIRSVSHPKKFRVLVSEQPTKVGGVVMKERLAITDVADVPVGGEFDLEQRLTYWNPTSEMKEKWCGTMVRSPILKTSFMLIMPKDRPFKWYKLRVAKIDGDQLVPYEGEQIVFADPDHRYIFWEIVKPKPGYVYRIDWDW
ncbi:MAG: hypothetical protein Tsb009_07270 [Planctomycetaceae bacterium]